MPKLGYYKNEFLLSRGFICGWRHIANHLGIDERSLYRCWKKWGLPIFFVPFDKEGKLKRPMIHLVDLEVWRKSKLSDLFEEIAEEVNKKANQEGLDKDDFCVQAKDMTMKPDEKAQRALLRVLQNIKKREAKLYQLKQKAIEEIFDRALNQDWVGDISSSKAGKRFLLQLAIGSADSSIARLLPILTEQKITHEGDPIILELRKFLNGETDNESDGNDKDG